MSTLSVRRLVVDGEVSARSQLSATWDDIETFLNVTKLNSDNLQNSAVGETQLASNAVTTSKVQTGVITSDKFNDASITGGKLAANAVESLIPIGAIMAYAGTSAPAGYLLCDGAAVSRSTYADLFAVIGESHGEGNNTTTFNLPDLRGLFIRGKDGTAGRDADKASRTALLTGGATGNNPGSYQAAAVGPHAHTAWLADWRFPPSGNFFSGFGQSTSTYLSGSAGGSETRPKNVYENYIIRVS